MYASSMKAQVDMKKNGFSYTHADICEWKEYSIVSENKLFNREEAFLSRRILVCLATIAEQFPQILSMLFVRKCTVANDDQPKSFMELLSLTIRNFSHYVRLFLCYVNQTVYIFDWYSQRNVANVQGFIESACLFLTTVAGKYDINIQERFTKQSNNDIELLFSLAHSIVSVSQPSSTFCTIFCYVDQESDRWRKYPNFWNSFRIDRNQTIFWTRCALTEVPMTLRNRRDTLDSERIHVRSRCTLCSSDCTFYRMRGWSLASNNWRQLLSRHCCLCDTHSLDYRNGWWRKSVTVVYAEQDYSVLLSPYCTCICCIGLNIPLKLVMKLGSSFRRNVGRFWNIF